MSYGTLAYFGVNTFKFIAADGKATFGRYQIVPEMGKQFLSTDDAAKASHDYLLDEIRTRVGKGPVRFKFVLQLPAPGDKLEFFKFIIDPPYCCYRAGFDGPDHQIFYEALACFQCESPVPTQRSTWGLVKGIYR